MSSAEKHLSSHMTVGYTELDGLQRDWFIQSFKERKKKTTHFG